MNSAPDAGVLDPQGASAAPADTSKRGGVKGLASLVQGGSCRRLPKPSPLRKSSPVRAPIQEVNLYPTDSPSAKGGSCFCRSQGKGAGIDTELDILDGTRLVRGQSWIT